MKFDLTSPCGNCPFRSDVTPYLYVERVVGILRAITKEDKTFACHKTTHGGPKGKTRRHDQQMCAGARILLAKIGWRHRMLQLAERLGLLDPSVKMNMDAPVYDSCEAMIEATRQECARP